MSSRKIEKMVGTAMTNTFWILVLWVTTFWSEFVKSAEWVDVPNVEVKRIELECGWGGEEFHGDFLRLLLPPGDEQYSVFGRYIYRISQCPKNGNKIRLVVGKVSDSKGNAPSGGEFLLTWFDAGQQRVAWFKDLNSETPGIVVSYYGGQFTFEIYKSLKNR